MTMSFLREALTLSLAYLIGSIPFGYLIARGVAGIDIRTVGSGNIGATNVGRVLGFRFFVAVFLLDFAKGFLPTYFLPSLLGSNWPDLPVGVAVATILGHNFPIFLGFRGGKGVATSLGAVWALDSIASMAAASGFGVLIATTRFVSVASLGGGLTWIAVHFARADDPWGRGQIALSVASIGLMGLLIARHRKNLARLADGTEPRVSIGRGRESDDLTSPPSSAADRRTLGLTPRALLILALIGLVGGATAAIYVWVTGQKAEVDAGPYHAEEVARVATGHQRVERLVFADGGNLLAATCPRYNRVMLYRVTAKSALELVADIDIEGRPVALAAGRDRIYALVRPKNDARHIEEGWWQAFNFQGRAISPKHRVGLYPDDFALVGPSTRLGCSSSDRVEARGTPTGPPPR